MFKNGIIVKILEHYKDIWALGYVSALSQWDTETYMPHEGASVRGEALSKISSLSQRLFLDKDFVSLIHKAGEEKNLNDYEKGVVRMLLRSLKYYEKLPKEFIEEFEKLTSEATVVWRKAKEANNFKLFQPYLEKIFKMSSEKAEYLGYKDSAYDALLDEYEEGLTSREVSNFFNEINNPLTKLLKKIEKSNKNKDHFLERQTYNQEKLKKLNNEILKLFWKDFSRFRIDISAHPFTTSFSSSDTRITTWYHKEDFARSVLATIHEFGHALYELQGSKELEMTPIGGGSSLVIHESQSRFWENYIGTSMNMAKFIESKYPELGKSEDIYSYFNKVKPGPLRVEADEVTYHFHVMLRFELEKGTIEGKYKVKDFPDIWNTLMKKYLGITPKNDSEGVLQDIHWSGGSVGYFPTYSMGTFLSGVWREKLEKEIEKGDYEAIKTWLKENIHKYGSTYTLKDLLEKNNLKFSVEPLLSYLNSKYQNIY